MPIHIKSTNHPRTTAREFNMSQWTNKTSASATYRRLDGSENPSMMRADTIAFNPMEMFRRTNITPTQTDHSYRTLEHLRKQPVYVTAGAFVLFLLVLRYLSTHTK